MEILRVDNELYWSKRITWFLQNMPDLQVYVGRERQLWDRSRVDILTAELAIEVDWARKYAEAVGQCLWYSLNFNRQPGVVLLVEDLAREAKYLYRARTLCTSQRIALWFVNVKKAEIDVDGTRYPLPSMSPAEAARIMAENERQLL